MHCFSYSNILNNNYYYYPYYCTYLYYWLNWQKYLSDYLVLKVLRLRSRGEIVLSHRQAREFANNKEGFLSLTKPYLAIVFKSWRLKIPESFPMKLRCARFDVCRNGTRWLCDCIAHLNPIIGMSVAPVLGRSQIK